MRYSCRRCGSIYEEYIPLCSQCWSCAVFPMPVEGERSIRSNSNRRGIRNIRELKRGKGAFTCYPELGKLSRQWRMLAFGEPGGGKSTFSLRMAEHFESSLYVAHEEGDDTIREKADRLELTKVNVTDAENIGEVIFDIEDLGRVDILIIDSVTSLQISIEEFEILCQKVPRIIAICQITKDKQHAGTMKFPHLVDIVVKMSLIENTMTGIITKNRFAELQSFTVLDTEDEKKFQFDFNQSGF